MQISQAGLDLIKSYEGIEDGDKSTVNLDPYICPAGYWTIGWGHVVIGPDGAMLRGQQTKRLAYAMYPRGITMVEAETLLRNDVRRFEVAVDRAIEASVEQLQFDAMVSLAFNIGAAGFAKSSVARLHNLRQQKSELAEAVAVEFIVRQGRTPSSAADAFLMWNKANGSVSNGLVRRRLAERRLYLGE